MIDITPVDVRKKKGDFRRTMRGYDPALVDDFLDLVADRLEELVRENLALAERTGRQDQQVTEYRDRERALTEALVTAQQMREEIRQQTTREAEAARHAAESETSQLRATVQLEMEALRAAAEQEVRELREAARRESQELRAAAQRETQELRTAAQREAEEMRAATQRDEAQLRTKVTREREREAEEFRRLRKRQEQFLTSYRAFLERELKELGTFARAVGLTAAAAAATAEAEPQAPESSPTQPAPTAPQASGSAGLSLVDDDFAAPGDDPDLGDLAFAEPVEAGDDVGLTDALEPFEPEPIEPEDLTKPGFAPLAVNEVDALLGTLSAEPEDTRPIDLGPHGWAAPPEWNLPNIDVTEPSSNKINFGTDDKPPAASDDEGDDVDTTLLLRNAEAAGYRVDDLDNEGDELLLDEELPADKQKEDDGWLPSLLEDGDK